MTSKLINYYHTETNEVVLKLLGDTGEVKYKKVQCDKYFHIKTEDKEKVEKLLQNFSYTDKFSHEDVLLDFSFETINDKYTKVVYEGSEKMYLFGAIRYIIEKLESNNIESFETDLLPGDNYVLDHNYEISDKYRVLYWDIETRDDTGDVQIGRDKILSICGVDNTGKEFIFCDDSETKVLNDFTKLLKDYEIICGWNSESFDFPYIKARLKFHEIYFSFKPLIHIDLMRVFMGSSFVKTRISKEFITSYSLNAIAKTFIKDSKLEIEDSGSSYGGKIWRLYNEDRDTLIRYNLQDCKLLKRLDDEFKLIDNEVSIAQLAKFPLSKTRSSNPIVDAFVLREARKRGEHLPSKKWGVSKATYEGGLCELYKPGMYSNVVVFDWSSLYPSLVRLFGIDCYNKIKNNNPAKHTNEYVTTFDGFKYKRAPRGILPTILDDMTELRFKLRDEQQKYEKGSVEGNQAEHRQLSAKVVILAAYGVQGSNYYRLYDLEVAASITGSGRALMRFVIEYIGKLDYCKWLYTDTDSFFIAFDDLNDVDRFEKEIHSFVDSKVLEYTGEKNKHLRFETEKIASSAIFLAKKKYCMKVVAE